MVLVARRHWRETAVRNGIFKTLGASEDAVIIDQLWHSDVIMGSGALDSEAVVWRFVERRREAWDRWPKGGPSPVRHVEMEQWVGLRTTQGGAWRELCVAETWIPHNHTLIRHVVTGPEDPKAL